MVKDLRIALFIALLAIVSGCDDNEPVEPTPEMLFTLNVDAAYLTAGSDNWVMIQGPDGKLIEAKHFEQGNVVRFETTAIKPEKIHVTLFSYDSTAKTNRRRLLKSYLDIAPGREWTLKNIAGTAGSDISVGGEITVNVSDIGSVEGFGFSGKHGSSGGSSSSGNGVFSATTDLLNPGSRYVISLETVSGSSKYKFIPNAQAQTYQLSYNDFNDFDKHLDVSFPPTTHAWVFFAGREDDQKLDYFTGYQLYRLSPGWSGQARSSVSLGYLNEFKQYGIVMDLNYDTHKYTYFYAGAMPERIQFPERFAFGIKNSTLVGYSLLEDPDFNFRLSTYSYVDNSGTIPNYLSWSVFAPHAYGIELELPPSLVTSYTLSEITKLAHTVSYFTYKGRTYDEAIGVELLGQDSGYPELYRVEVR